MSATAFLAIAALFFAMRLLSRALDRGHRKPIRKLTLYARRSI
jgi:hypothetical protein